MVYGTHNTCALLPITHSLFADPRKKFLLTLVGQHDLYIRFKKRYYRLKTVDGGDRLMNKSPCLACELVSEDKNKCLENCDKLKQYQELLLKQGIYAKI